MWNRFRPSQKGDIFLEMLRKVVLLHGLTGSRRIFRILEERLRRDLAAQTCSFDLLGFGENKLRGSDYTVSEHLGFVTSTIQKQFPDGPVILIGHSMGGLLALSWACHHAERVSSIVLLNTPLADSRQDITTGLQKEPLSWGNLLLKHRSLSHLCCLLFAALDSWGSFARSSQFTCL